MFGTIKTNIVSTIAFGAVLLLGLIVSGFYLYNIGKWASYPDFGYGFRTATGINVAGMVTGNGFQSGLRVGDRFVEINGDGFTNIAEFRELMKRESGEENIYLVERKGQRFILTIKNVADWI